MYNTLCLIGTIPKIQKDKVAKLLAFMSGFITAKIYVDNDNDDDKDEDKDEDPCFLEPWPRVLYRCEDNDDDDDQGPGMAGVAAHVAPQPIAV